MTIPGPIATGRKFPSNHRALCSGVVSKQESHAGHCTHNALEPEQPGRKTTNHDGLECDSVHDIGFLVFVERAYRQDFAQHGLRVHLPSGQVEFHRPLTRLHRQAGFAGSWLLVAMMYRSRAALDCRFNVRSNCHRRFAPDRPCEFDPAQARWREYTCAAPALVSGLPRPGCWLFQVLRSCVSQLYV